MVVLRDGADEASAAELLERTGWADRAERDHYVLLLPNPVSGWGPDEDAFSIHWLTTATQQYLLGCKVHRTSVYLAGFGRAASLAARMALRHGGLLAGVYLEGPLSLKKAPHRCRPGWWTAPPGWSAPWAGLRVRQASPFRSFRKPEQSLCTDAWDALFLGAAAVATGDDGTVTRKYTEQEMGLTCFENQTFLGDNGGMAHTWYEFAPAKPSRAAASHCCLHCMVAAHRPNIVPNRTAGTSWVPNTDFMWSIPIAAPMPFGTRAATTPPQRRRVPAAAVSLPAG